MKTAAQYCLISMAVMISFRTLSMAEVTSSETMASSETRLHRAESTMGVKMVRDLFVNLAFEDFR